MWIYGPPFAAGMAARSVGDLSIAQAEANGVVTEARSGTFLELLEGVNIEVDPATFQRALSDTRQLAQRYKLSAYDAFYLELALRRGLPLATLDEDLRKAAKKAGVKNFKN